jgi:hypothetical protein
LQAGALERATGDATVIIAVRQLSPPLALLAGHIGGAGFALRIQRVERLLEPLIGGLARVDGAADRRLAHGRATRPKKRGPDHLVPVIARAIAESERCRAPRQR